MQPRFQTVIMVAVIITLTFYSSAPARADMRRMNDVDMAGIDGMGGLSIGLGRITFYFQAEKIRIADTDMGNTLELSGLTISNGRGGPATIQTGNVDTDFDGLMSPLTIDVATIGDPQSPVFGRTVAVFQALDWLEESHVHVDRLRFCGQELGSLDIGVIHRPSYAWIIGGHEQGIDFEYATRLSIDTLRLTYNNQGENFDFSGIHLAHDFSGAPENPDQWRPGGMFRIGDFSEGYPAAFDVGRDSAGFAGIEMSLPIRGSLRIENTRWAGQDFGPLAIDGIRVHRLTVRFVP